MLPALAEQINASGGGPDWGASPYELSPDDFEAFVGQVVSVVDDQANFGAMRPLEMFLLQNEVAFDRLSGANDGYSAFLLKGRRVDGAYTNVETLATSDGEPALVFDEIEAVLDRAQTLEEATTSLRRALGLHFGEVPPLVLVDG